MNSLIQNSWWSLCNACALAAVMGVIMLSGCATTPAGATAKPDMPPAAEGPGYKVIFANHMGGKAKIYHGQVTPGVTVQDALEASGATRKYKGMLIDLARRVPDKNHVLKLPVNYDHEVSHVIDAQNYAIHPGDEILVRQNNPGAMDAMFRSLNSSGMNQRR